MHYYFRQLEGVENKPMIKGDHQLAKLSHSLDWGALFSSEACADIMLHPRPPYMKFPTLLWPVSALLRHWQPYSTEYTICMRLVVNYYGSDLSHCTTIILQLLTNLFGLFIFTLYMALKVLVHSNRQEYFRSTDETECLKQLVCSFT